MHYLGALKHIVFEVTARVSGKGRDSFLELLLAEQWIRNDYYLSDITGRGYYTRIVIVLQSHYYYAAHTHDRQARARS